MTLSNSKPSIIVEKLFWLLISALGIIVAGCFSYVAYKMDTISDSVVELNSNIAVIIERGKSRDKSLIDHELRLRSIEKK